MELRDKTPEVGQGISIADFKQCDFNLDTDLIFYKLIQNPSSIHFILNLAATPKVH